MAGRRRTRTGRGWDAAPPRPPRAPADPAGDAGRPRGGRARQPAESTDPAEQAREICLRLLAVRPRTRSELATALRQRGIEDEICAEILARYSEVGMIDDAAFAKAWVSSRHHGKGLARRALASELRQKGVDSDTVGAALDELDPQTEAATARTLVDRKLRTERPLPRAYPARRAATEGLLRRMVGMLARKGYGPGLAVRVVRDAIDDWSAAHAGETYARQTYAGAEKADVAGEDGVDADLDLIAEAMESEANTEPD